MNTNYPLNPRDEDQPVLPHGDKMLFITLGIFFILVSTTVLLLNYATAQEVQYSNLESDAAEPTGTQLVGEQPISDQIADVQEVLEVPIESVTIPQVPQVNLGP